MHIHAYPASASGQALAGAQAAEASVALRRSKELREAASELWATSFSLDPGVNPKVVEMIGSWANHSGGDGPPDGAAQSEASGGLETERTLPLSPVSYWA